MKDLDEKLKTALLLVGIFLVGFSVVYLSHGPRLSDPDAWHYYNLVKDVLDQGEVRELDLRAYYPEGANWRIRDNLFHSYFIAYTYKAFQPLGVPLMSYLMLFPAIFGGGLGAVCLYLAVNELFDRRTALLSALLYAFMPLMLSRVYSGTIDKETVYGITVYPALYFFIKSYKTKISFSRPKSLIFPILTGIFYGLAYGSWSGGSYTILVISTASAIYFVFSKDANMMKALLITGMVGPMVMHLLQPMRYPFNYFFPNLNSTAPIVVSFFPLFSITISDLLKSKKERDVAPSKVFMASIAFAVAFLFLIGKGALVYSFINAIQGTLFLESKAQEEMYMATVAESQPSRLFGGGETILQRILNGDFARELNLALFVLPAGIFLLSRRFWSKKDFPSIFTLAWILSGAYAATQGLRLLFFMAPSAAVVTGFTFASLYDKIKGKEAELQRMLKSSPKKKISQQAEGRLTNVKMAHLVLLLIVFSVTFSVLNASVAGRGGFQSDLPKPWYDALIWTKENTPENSVIFFWWDYGYYFQAVANRYTVADGGGNVLRNVNLANMFSSPEDEAIRYIKKYVDYEKVPTYMVVSYEEFGKSGAINRIAAGDPEMGAARFDGDGRMKDGQIYIGNFQVPRTGNFAEDEKAIGNALARNRISTYYIVNAGDAYIIWALVQFDQNGNYHPEWSDKLLAKLLPFNTGYGQGLKHFELVYQDQWNYILIYRIK